jgi:hypothetical protein
MAEYIDRDALFKHYMALANIEWNKTVAPISWCDAYEEIADHIAELPPADVVPKSEVDDLKRYIILNEDIAIKCKQENGEQNEEYWKGKISAFRQIRAYIDAELKKKYTEIENDIRRNRRTAT